MRYCTFSAEDKTRFGFYLSTSRICDLLETALELHKKGALRGTSGDLFQSRNLKEWLSFGQEAHEVASRIKSLVQHSENSAKGIYLLKQTRLLAPISNP